MTTACIVWILWTQFPNGVEWAPYEGYQTWLECRQVRSGLMDKADGARSYACFPHTFDPRVK